ncbi:MAG: hypothetical protein CFE21_01710 [Bacteroidetes bacterium B1(2017)]|nr:MAG: hypothetical protein CFE21_01710 [Bacteroidetes bacterium B1(2017)]
MKKLFLLASGLSILFACGDPAPATQSATTPAVVEQAPTMEQTKAKIIANLEGKWQIKMDVQQNDCDVNGEKPSTAEVWTIESKDLELFVHIDDAGELVKEFKGIIQDNKLILEGDKQDVIGVYEMNLDQLESAKTMLGKKSIVYPGPCSMEYKITATR